MLTQEKARVLLRYYRTAILYLLLTATLTAVIFGLRVFNIFIAVPITIATLHLGTLGALTLGLMGLYLRLFYSLESVRVNEWTVKTIHIIMNVGIGILTLGFLLDTWPVMAVGFIGVAYAGFWWVIQYFRWFFQAEPQDRKGALLFGAFGSLGLAITILIGGYLFHGYLSENTLQSMRLPHIHAGFVGWASLGLLGIGVALRGGELPVTKSVPVLQGSAWVWLIGIVTLLSFMVAWKLSSLMIAGGIILLGFLGYGYSMPKVGDLGSTNSQREDAGGSLKLLPFIIVGFLALSLTILLGFDIAVNYPSGRAGSHRIFGVGGWVLLTFLMALLSEIPLTTLALQDASISDHSRLQQFLYPGPFKFAWIFITLALLVMIGGFFAAATVLFIGAGVLGLIVALLSLYILLKYSPRTTVYP